MDQVARWANFYVIVGTAAAALVGMQFVVLTLIATMRRRATTESISAFGTPTVVHLGGALTISALMDAPWPTLAQAAATLALFGFAGAGYSALIFRRACRQTVYQPEPEDWLWYALLPCLIYVVEGLAALALERDTGTALLGIGTSALTLLLLAIHNAWDTVTYIVAGNPQKERPEKESGG